MTITEELLAKERSESAKQLWREWHRAHKAVGLPSKSLGKGANG